MAGFRELLAIDFYAPAVACFRDNFPGVPCWRRDVREVTAAEILEETGLERGELDVLDSSPPCQGFSMSGKRKYFDQRNWLFKEVVRLVDGLRPRAFLVENVAGLLMGEMKTVFRLMMRRLSDLDGYEVRARLMNAANHGVPQSRPRTIIFGVDESLGPPRFPKPDDKILTVRDAFAAIEDDVDDGRKPTPLTKRLLPMMKAGDHFNRRLGDGRRLNWMRLRWDAPSHTLPSTPTGAGMVFHPDGDRPISSAEIKALCSFPQSFRFKDYRTAGALMGNAVMPEFMRRIALELKATLENGGRGTREVALADADDAPAEPTQSP
jgi:DNA (cytosine-5)-methyltransferase 1